MGARLDAIEMFNDFRTDDWFKDSFYDASWVKTTISGGGAFGGGTKTDETLESVVLLMGNKDIKKIFGDGIDLSSKYIKAVIDEFGIPEIGTEITFDGDIYSAVQIKEDSVGALVSIELKV